MLNKINYKSTDDKVRIRSQKELEVRKNEFLKICGALDNLKIRYFLLGGVLLGAIRNNDFIPWDWDVEICVYSDEVITKVDNLLSELDNLGLVVIKYNKEPSIFKIDLLGKLPKATTKYTVMGWNHDKIKGVFWRKTLKIPEHFINDMKKIEFFNKLHLAPYPPEEYLVHQYGNWKTPLQTSNKFEYLTKKYYGKNNVRDFFEKIFNFIKRRVRKLK